MFKNNAQNQGSYSRAEDEQDQLQKQNQMTELKQLDLSQQYEDFQHKKIQDLSFKANQAKHLSKLANEITKDQKEPINYIEK